MYKSYQELSKEIDDKLKELGSIVHRYKISEIVERLDALEEVIKRLQSTYK